MPPTSTPDPERDEQRSLATRVAIGTASVAAVTALVSVTVALVLAGRLVQRAEDQRLSSTARALAVELEELEKGAVPASRDALVREVDDERHELLPAGIRVAARDANGPLGVTSGLPDPGDETCTTVREDAHLELRACAVRRAGITVTAGAVQTKVSSAWLALGGLVATLVSALFAATWSRRAASWALSPLTRLEREVTKLPVDDARALTRASHEMQRESHAREVRALRDALGALLARLGEAMERARRFSGEAAHELRTPLTTLSAELDLLAEEPLAPEARAAVERLRARTRDLATLVEGLLALSSDEPLTRTENVALEDLAHESLTRLPEASRARVKIVAESPGMVRGDATLLASLVQNALENALKFSEDEITITVHEGGGDVRLDVEDLGPGVSHEDRAHVFEPFFRSARARAGTGTQGPTGHGLGLSLAAHIARVHGGRVELSERSDGRQGARFRLSLPRWRPEVHQGRAQGHPGEREGERPRK